MAQWVGSEPSGRQTRIIAMKGKKVQAGEEAGKGSAEREGIGGGNPRRSFVQPSWELRPPLGRPDSWTGIAREAT
jgi:hypothetical protein